MDEWTGRQVNKLFVLWKTILSTPLSIGRGGGGEASLNTDYTDGTKPKRDTEFLKEHGNETPPSLPQGEECLTGAS